MREHSEIIDIFLVSNMKEADFIYGSSDLNLIFIVENKAHPRTLLKEIRKSLRTQWVTSLLVNLDELKVFKEAEIKDSKIRSVLMTKNIGETVLWKSLTGKKAIKFNLKANDHFAIKISHIRSIEKFLLDPKFSLMVNRHWIRSFGKNVYRSILGLSQYNLIQSTPPAAWFKYSKKLFGFSFLAKSYYISVKVMSFGVLDYKSLKTTEHNYFTEGYDESFLSFTRRLLTNNIVEDILLTPALIQLSSDEVKGKVFIDIIISGKSKSINIQDLNAIFEQVQDFAGISKQLKVKYVFRQLTPALFDIQIKNALFQYPLEHLYRNQQTISLSSKKYNYECEDKHIKEASIYFLLNQFMRFRSLEQKTDLIGSRFIKSLNIIYRYQLLLEYLQGKEFALSHSYKSIIEHLGPQLQHLRPETEVDLESWKIIRLQMLYLLKNIRDELAKEHPSLKILQF